MESMYLVRFVVALYFILGIYCIYRPFYLLLLFASFPVVNYIPTFPDPESGSLLHLVSIGSINLYLYDYLLCILLLVVVRKYFTNKSLFKLTVKSNITKFLIALFVWELFIGILSYIDGFFIENILRYLSRESIMFLAFFIPLTDDIYNKKNNFYNFTIIIGLILFVFALLRIYVTGQVVYTSSSTARVLSSNANIIIMFPICYLLFFRDAMNINKYLRLMLVLVLIAGLSMTGYRSAWVVLFFVLTVFCLNEFSKKIKYLWIPLWGFSIILLITLIVSFINLGQFEAGESFAGDVVLRVGDTFDLSNSTTMGRLETWSYALDVVKERPLLGLGRFPVHTEHLAPDNLNMAAFSELVQAVHNMFFDKLLHEGMFGLGLVLAFLVFLIVVSSKLKYQDSDFALFIKIYILSFIIFSLFNTTFSNVTGKIYFYMAVGLLNAKLIQTKYQNVK